MGVKSNSMINTMINGLSFARERISKYWAQLRTPVENCVEKWQNRHICLFDLLSSESLPNFVINVQILSIAIRKQRKAKKSACGKHSRTLKKFFVC